MKKVVCHDCNKDITHAIQVYWRGVVKCEDCNVESPH